MAHVTSKGYATYHLEIPQVEDTHRCFGTHQHYCHNSANLHSSCESGKNSYTIATATAKWVNLQKVAVSHGHTHHEASLHRIS